MSCGGGERETNADRITAIQKRLPPAKGVKSPTGYASLDEVARRLRTTRSQLIKWKNGAEPIPRHREALAKLSGGLYAPDDFKRLSVEQATSEMRNLIAALEARLKAVEDGERATDEELRSQLAALAAEVQAAQGDLDGRDRDAPVGSQGEPV